MGSNLKYALRRSVSIMIGFFPIGLAYGILMDNAGYNYLWSGLTSLVVLAGSLQYLMLTFLTDDVPIYTVVVMSLLLNSRHIFYGLSFIEKFREYGAWRYFLIYGLSDENYSLLCSYKPQEGTDEKTVAILCTALLWLYWTAFSMLGGLVGKLLTFNTAGIDFALTALFIVILLDQLKDADSKLPAVLAAAAGVLCILIFGAGSFILPALIVTVAALTVLRPVLDRPAAKEEVGV